jgi:RNA polymerase sigma factor (sigma-70 family)
MGMAQTAARSIIRQIESLFDGGSVTGLSDPQLLERFTARRDAAGDAAFATLVARHGPMVLHVCRQLVPDRHHAEDAFQVVFMVLARNASSIRDPNLLASWLYGVALRAARKAKIRLARERIREERSVMCGPGPLLVVDSKIPSADELAMVSEHAQALHDEIDRLPGAFRSAVVLCYMEGLTVDEAARRLRWPAGTVRSRMARARDKLRRALTRRGVILPAAGLAAALAARSASASVSCVLCAKTTRAAVQFAARQGAIAFVSASTGPLAQEVLRSMALKKLRFLASTLLALGVVAASTSYLTRALATSDEPRTTRVGGRPPTAVRFENQAPPPTKSDPAAGRMTVTGRVLDTNGKPMARVPVDVLGRPRGPWVAAGENVDTFIVLGRGSTGDDGRFGLDASRTRAASFFEVYALAASPGFGLNWSPLNADAGEPSAEIRIRPEQVIRGTLVDVAGGPVAGVEIRVAMVRRPYRTGPIDGIRFWEVPAEGLRTWPAPVRTDNHGHFVLSGVGLDTDVFLDVRDLRYARMGLKLAADDRAGPRDVTLTLQPSTIIEGRAVAADTGQPIPRALIAVGARQGELGGGFTTRFRADDQGRFQANPTPGAYFNVIAFPPEGQPYLAAQVEFAWTKGAIRKAIDIQLPGGVLIRGKVTEDGSGSPLAGATVQFRPMRTARGTLSGSQSIVASKEDGSFQIVVPAGKGHLLVFGPTSDYILDVIGDRMLSGGQPGGRRNYAHKIVAYEVSAGDEPHVIDATLRRGKSVRGRVVGPNGQTVQEARILSRVHIQHFNLFWRGDSPRLQARDGYFELNGLDPQNAVPVYFLDTKNQWGAAVELSGKQAGEEGTVRLQPCGQGAARFVTAGRKPLASTDLSQLSIFEIVVTPGPHFSTRDKTEQSQLAADAYSVSALDLTHYATRPVTDSGGRVTFPALIPGALYRISDFSTRNVQGKGIQTRKDFIVKPGETIDLGDIVIEKPFGS